MVDDPNEPTEHPEPWLSPREQLVRGVGAALDAKKLLLAALGLALLHAGWRLLDTLFPGSAALTPSVLGRPPVAELRLNEELGTVLVRAAAAVAEPARTVTAPFLSLFAVASPRGAFWHALLAALWAAVVWGIIGGAIARIAVVQLASPHGERVGLRTALRFALGKWSALIGAPLSPLLGVVSFALMCGALGLLYRLPDPAGPTVAGLLAFLPLLAGLVMAILLLGLAAGWPLMHATIAAEGEDAFDALSRSYAYVYQRPLRGAAYVATAWGLGVLGVLVVGLFARSAVHLARWGLSLGAPAGRLDAVFAPGAAATTPAAVHAGWLSFVDLLASGWAYSYFWTAATIIYLLLRHDVDGTAWSDIYIPGQEADAFLEPDPAEAEAEPEPETPIPAAVPAVPAQAEPAAEV